MLAFCLGFLKNSVKNVMVTKPEGVERSMCVEDTRPQAKRQILHPQDGNF